MALGYRLRDERLLQGISQPELCRRVNAMLPEDARQLSQQSVASLEKRDSNSTEYVLHIAAVLGVSAWWLATGLGDKQDSQEVSLTKFFPGIELDTLLKLSFDERKFLAGRLQSEAERLLAKSSRLPDSSVPMPDLGNRAEAQTTPLQSHRR